MKKGKDSIIVLSFLLIISICSNVNASTIAIIDSGVDYKHIDLVQNLWVNQNEIPNNDRDEDHNGYQDDIYGWNFAENNNQVIDYKYLGTQTPQIEKFFAIQTKNFYGKASQDDIAWVRKMFKDPDFLKSIQIFGNFMHGTHVTGISVKGNANSRFLSVKLIPTEVKLPGQSLLVKRSSIGLKALKIVLDKLAAQQMLQMEEIAAYIDFHGANVANGSFGTGYKQAKLLIKKIVSVFTKKPKEEMLNEAAKYFINRMLYYGENFVSSAPNTLFVFAAGNDGTNNDIYPSSPANIKADNVITVGASFLNNQLANFSNFGNMVDVAAPGVGIRSTSPGDNYMTISGTSQAAPYVSNIAAKIYDINSSLTPLQIKTIIIRTVDKKRGININVKSGGIVNMDRAINAANLSLTMSLKQAIKESHINILGDTNLLMNFKSKQPSKENSFVLDLPSPFKI